MDLKALQEIVSETEYLNNVLRDEAHIPFNMHLEQVTAEALIEYAKENAWVLEMAISIAQKCEKVLK
jgi:hypothetical protein